MLTLILSLGKYRAASQMLGLKERVKQRSSVARALSGSLSSHWSRRRNYPVMKKSECRDIKQELVTCRCS